MVEETLVAILETLTDNVYPMYMPQNPVYPAITYQRISGKRKTSHEGPPGLAFPLFQLTLFHETYTSVKELASDALALLDGYKDMANGIHAIFVEMDRDEYNPEPKEFSVIMDIRVWCEENVYGS